jgi:hypothetical protein
VLANTSGFVYYVSMTGITGSALPDPSLVGEAVKRIKRTPTAGLRRLRRQDGRAGKGTSAHRRRRRRRHGNRQCGRQCACRKAEGHRPPIRRGCRNAGSAACPSGARSPCCCRIVFPYSKSRSTTKNQEFSMNWITNYVRPKINSMLGRREVPENLWIKAPETGEMVFHKDLEDNQWVIPAPAIT